MGPRTITGPKNSASPGNGRRHILVADDSPTARDQLSSFLVQRGYKCRVVNDACQALEAAEKDRYDLVFLDVVMPGMDGYTACRKIKAMEHYKKTPVVLLTSRNSTTDRVYGLMAGCSRYLTKPVRPNELDEVLSTLCPPYRADSAGTAGHSLPETSPGFS